MALDDLIARLEQDADAQVAAIARAADADVATIDADTRTALEARTVDALQAARLAREAGHQRARADARRLARARELDATHATLDRIFARALALLPEVTESEPWAAVWPVLAREAASYVNGACRIRCTPRIAAVIRPGLASDERIAIVEDESVGPGIAAEAIDGSVRVDASLPTLLARRRPRLSLDLLPGGGR